MSAPEFWNETWSVPARTIDMLGRQQIANIPTALHELFKNAHDAYADRVTVDFYRSDRLILIRDDGDGMTRDQMRRGWLTLASSAKRDANRHDGSEPVATERPRRTIMGEKGIGRLAIASIGPQVLILTRARSRDAKVQPLHVSLVHWGVNQLADIDLSCVAIPTMRFEDVGLPDGTAIRMLADRLIANVEGMRSKANSGEVDRIIDDLRLFDVDPALDLAELDAPSLADGGHGTQFVVRPTDESLIADLTPHSDDELSQVEKYLLGFSNTMMPDRPSPSILAAFNDHREDGTVSRPIGDQAFFTPADFRIADHSIEGAFDPFGHFRGRISVYGGEPRVHEIAWRGLLGAKTRCGPFRVTFAYLQGNLRDSRLDPEAWSLMSAKLNKMGGLYVYRDGIRLLPYGGPDQDFVGIERRRTKSASDWFFSYRRMFGAIEITHEDNERLREKAGREGFIRDGAYNDFVAILSSFFETLAIDFFRDSSRHGDWVEAKERFNREAALLAKRNKSAKAKLARFSKELDGFFQTLENGGFAKHADRLRSEVRARLSTIPTDPIGGGAAVVEVELEVSRQLARFDADLIVTKPKGAGLSKARAADWEAYGRNVQRLRSDMLQPLREELFGLVNTTVETGGLLVDRRRRVVAVIDDRGERAVADASRLRRKVGQNLDELRTGITRTVKEAVSVLAAKVEGTRIELLSTGAERLGDADLERMQLSFEQTIETSALSARNLLEGLADQLTSLMEAVRRGETLDETTDAIETQSNAYREQLDQYVELAQLGSAVGVLQHEFSSAVTRVRGAVRRLSPWARSNPALHDLDRDLRDGFEHLDAYLNLFAPLSKRLSRTVVNVSGREIATYMQEVFGDRIERHGVRVAVEDGFEGKELKGQPSAVLASFVNLMDNALHWLARAPVGSRVVSLGVEGDGMTISNSGPGIEARMADRIFEYGETTREGGRGMGLYVSREALRRSGLDLTLLDVGADRHPRFRIAPASGANEETDT